MILHAQDNSSLHLTTRGCSSITQTLTRPTPTAGVTEHNSSSGLVVVCVVGSHEVQQQGYASICLYMGLSGVTWQQQQQKKRKPGVCSAAGAGVAVAWQETLDHQQQ
jgi:hypothetical protein